MSGTPAGPRQHSAAGIGAIARDAIEVHGALQRLGELAEFLEYLDGELELEPRILEVGSDAGGTLYAWRALRPRAHITAISVDASYSTHRPLEPHGAEVIEARSELASTVARAWNDAPFDLVFIDADHGYAGCWGDVQRYLPMVSRAGLLALHDISNGDGAAEIEVPKVWERLKFAAPSWRPGGCRIREFTSPNPAWAGIGVLKFEG